MLTVTATVGIPRSGKSSFARDEMKKHKNLRRVNRDDIRGLIAHENLHNTNPFENEVSQIQHYLTILHLKNKFDVIIDNTNVKAERLNDIKKSIQEYCNEVQLPVLFQVKLFNTDFEECVRRNEECRKRGDRFVPLDIIKAMSSTLANNINNSSIKEFKEVIYPFAKIEQLNDLPSAIICDIDGTVADISHRNPYDTAKCLDDRPKQEIVDLVKLLSQKHKIIFVSGREEQFRDITALWIADAGMPCNGLYMRPTGDSRKDSVIKSEILENELLPKYNVALVLDDRLNVVKMWRSLGLTCLQVDWGDF